MLKRKTLSPAKRATTSVNHPHILSPEQVINKLESCKETSGDFLAVIDDIIQSNPVNKQHFYHTTKTLYVHCIDLLNSANLTKQAVRDLTGKLSLELDNVPVQLLVELSDVIIDCVKKGKASNGRSLEFLPKVLSLVAMATTVTVGDGNEMEGTECKSHLLDSLCSVRWPNDCVIHVAAVCREIVLTDKELKFVIEKILRMLGSVEISDIAPLVYQLLLLATKGHKILVLTGVISFFNSKHLHQSLSLTQQEEATPDLFPTEGTVLLHISQAIKQDQELGKEFVKCLKAGLGCVTAVILSPFSVALAMSVTQIQRFEDQILDLMRTVVTRRLKDYDKWKNSKWSQEVIGEVQDIKQVLLETVRYSSHGWDLATQGLVQLGFYLMECSPGKDGGVAQQVGGLGSEVLQMVFKLHRVAQQEVLSQLLNRIITGCSSPSVDSYFSLLHSIITSEPQVVLDSLQQVHEAVSYLSLLPPAAATSLLYTLQPLVKISPSFRDSLLLVLRKSLFSRQPEARRSALIGYLQMLSSEGVASSLQTNWQFCSSQVPTSSSTGNEALCYEILGVLRRCLSQQDSVRVALYEGLSDIYQTSPQLEEPIMNLLLNQFNYYYHQDKEIVPPVELSSCVTISHGEATRVEPLDHLIRSVQLCVTCSLHRSVSHDDDNEIADCVTAARDRLDDLLVRMMRCELDDFEIESEAKRRMSVNNKDIIRMHLGYNWLISQKTVPINASFVKQQAMASGYVISTYHLRTISRYHPVDASADYSTAGSVGTKNVLRCSIVAGIYETLLEYAFVAGDKSMESCQNVLKMFRGYQLAVNILKEKGIISASSVGTKKSATGSRNHKLHQSMLSLKGLATMLQALISDELPAHQPGLGLLRESNALKSFLFTTALQAVYLFGSEVRSNYELNATDTNNAMATIGRCFYKLMGGRVLAPSTGHNKKDKGKPLVVMSVEGLHKLVMIMCSRGVDRLCHFLFTLDDVVKDGSEQEVVHHYIRHFQHYINSSVAGEASVLGSKETQLLVSLIATLSTKLDPSQLLDQVHGWVKAICVEWNLENDINLTKSLMSLMFTTTSRLSPDLTILYNLSEDVHFNLGDIEEDMEIDESKHFSVVTPRTSEGCVLPLIYQQTEQALEVIDWFMGHLKAEQSLHSLTVVDLAVLQESQGQDVVGLACERLCEIVRILHNLVRSADIPTKARSQDLFKCLQKFYSVLEQLTKHHFISYCQYQQELGDKYRELIDLVGSKLSQHVYAYITYKESVQAQAEPQQETRGKKKGKGTAIGGPGKASVKRDLRFIPELIYAIEQFEKELIKLSKKTKDNLMSCFKKSTSRDFRIDGTTVSAILHGQEDNEDNSSSAGSPKPKKMKLSFASNSTDQ